MRKNKIAVRLVFLGLALAALAHFTPLPAISWCHDYSYYRVTGKDSDNLSPGGLRNALAKLKYKLVQGSTDLRPGDVVIIGNAHSGFVNAQGSIDHYIQVREKLSDTDS